MGPTWRPAWCGIGHSSGLTAEARRSLLWRKRRLAAFWCSSRHWRMSIPGSSTATVQSSARTAAGHGVPGWSCGPGDADQVALGVGEVAHYQARWRPLRAHPALPAQALGLLQGGLDIGNTDVEEHVAGVALAAADTA